MKPSLCYLRSTTTLFCMFGEKIWLRISDCPLFMLCRLLQTAIGEEITVDKSSMRKTEDYSFVWKARLESTSFQESAKHLLVPAVLSSAETLCDTGASTISGRYRNYQKVSL